MNCLSAAMVARHPLQKFHRERSSSSRTATINSIRTSMNAEQPSTSESLLTEHSAQQCRRVDYKSLAGCAAAAAAAAATAAATAVPTTITIPTPRPRTSSPTWRLCSVIVNFKKHDTINYL